jgi:phospholipase/carboxylesterase
MQALVRHGTEDPVIEISFGRAAREALLAGGLAVDYEEFHGGHSIPAAVLPGAQQWLQQLIP